MSTVTGSSFIKSGADNTIVLLGAGGTKPISEFSSGAPDSSNYYTKTQTYSQTEANNKFVRLEGSIQQTITGRLNMQVHLVRRMMRHKIQLQIHI
ncbi:MAG: hypothetical protein EZS28_032423 [Streblomastix strix]|uniref:Uncharacterized protein n=1 Tax=Streblomastix strix TaxID=222440 RepID=A0A5J4UPM8_9EUKA|nr:MAG: hypothetical protein EZS28_032423 [Streblomastix strix]